MKISPSPLSRRYFLKGSTALGITAPIIVMSGCKQASTPSLPAASHAETGWGVDLQNINLSIRPGTDFFQHVNDGWINATEIPKGRSAYDAAWAVQDGILSDIDEMITSQSPSTIGNSPQNRIRDFFLSYIDAERIETLGLSPIAGDIIKISDLQTHEDIAHWMGNPRANSIFNLRVQPPANTQGGHILSLAQYRVTGLGLPSQAHYKSSDEAYVGLREKYRAYIEKILNLANIPRAEEKSVAILDLETRFANIMWDFAALRNAGAAFNQINVEALDQYAPGFPWRSFLKARGLEGVSSINISVGAIKESAALFNTISVDNWRSFLLFHWIDTHARFLPKAFSHAEFEFYDISLWNVTSQSSRKDRAVSFVQRYLGDDVGQLYVEQHLSAETRNQVGKISEFIRRAFRERIETLDWLDAATRKEAIAKIEAIIFEIGAPNDQIDWSGLRTNSTDLIGNFRRAVDHGWLQERNRIGLPITRFGDWNMKPHRVGLGYHQQYNKIFITAGMLQPPFFNPDADAAVNFGAIGHLIGHEFGHALDDQGSKFDSKGALRDWWSKSSRTEFSKRITLLINQYGSYEPLPDVHLASEQMIGEIIGDLAGMTAAFRAYEIYAQDKYVNEPPILDGYTGKQRFFLGAAQQSRTIMTDSALKSTSLNAAHPPARYRLNGILVNMDAWYESFGVTSEDALYKAPEDRVRLW